jgi:hypothetical protein
MVGLMRVVKDGLPGSCNSILLSALLASSYSVQPACAQAVFGGGLEQLVQMREGGSPKLQSVLKYHITSPKGEVLVDIHLQKGTTVQQILPKLTASGFRLQAVSELNPSLIEGYVSLDSARALGSTLGIKSILASHRPKAFAGRSQNQAVQVEKADLAQARGWDGSGIKIGVLSDSYDRVPGYPTAADDIANDDLPPGVVVLQEGNSGDSDEGRWMMQLIHDVAPGAQLGFATADKGLVNFSNNILALKRNFHADIIVDDVGYADEPMYSDGLIAQTIDQVASEGAACFTAAGIAGSKHMKMNTAPCPLQMRKNLLLQAKKT